jgi:putative peptide zinc metalloprotease protein
MLESQSQETMLRLRPELQMTLHQNRGTVYCLVEDPISNSFYRIGKAEWSFATQLDGHTPQKLAYQRTLEDVGRESLSPSAAQKLIPWLLANGLVRQLDAVPTKPPARSPGRLLMNFFFAKLPLGHPDRLLARLEPPARCLFTWPALITWCLLVSYAIVLVSTDWDRFVDSARSYLAPTSWLYLLCAWLTLKVIHELFHGLACKRFGGTTGACGIMLILFSPIAFVDVTSAWRFRNKWQRIVTSAAGMYVEFAIAAVAAIIWSGSASPGIAFACQSIVVTASVSSLLFNANPLMRFDGYYILADLLEIENLYTEGRHAVRSILRGCFLGLTTPSRRHQRRDQLIITTYGFAAAGWRILVSVSLVLAAATLFHGAGLALAAAGVLFWFAIPLFNFARFVVKGSVSEKPAVRRFLVRAALVGVALAAVTCVPVPGGVNAPAIVRYAPLHDLRAETDGFVRAVHVTSGESVTAGQVLLTLANDELAAEIKGVTAETKQSLIRSRIFHSDENYSEYQAELRHHQALNERLRVLRQRAGRLIVKAPATGKVITRRVDQLHQRYVRAGQRLLSIAAESSKEINVTIPEHHIESFIAKVGEKPMVVLDGSLTPLRDAVLVGVEPGASATLRFPNLGAHNGGPLPVQPEYSTDEQGKTIEAGYRLTSPRFYGSVRLPKDVAQSLRAGEIGQVRFTDRSETIGRKLQRVADRWIGRRLPGG